MGESNKDYWDLTRERDGNKRENISNIENNGRKMGESNMDWDLCSHHSQRKDARI